VGAFFIDALGTGMFLPFSLLFFLATTSLSLTQIGLGLSISAIVRIPVTIAAGPLSDRLGPRTAIVSSQLLQAAGFVGYLFVHGFWQLVAAAVLVQVGNSIFWAGYAPLIFAIAPDGEREHWFALVGAAERGPRRRGSDRGSHRGLRRARRVHRGRRGGRCLLRSRGCPVREIPVRQLRTAGPGRRTRYRASRRLEPVAA
jgi:hypothetical protein